MRGDGGGVDREQGRVRSIPTGRWRAVVLWVVPVALIGGLAVFLRHELFSGRPFWLDEAWVADWLRGRPQHLFWMSPPTPPLWEASLRLVPPIGGPERYRVIPFLFSMGTLIPAAALGARMRRGRLFVYAGALALALSPHLIARPDLKQYTAEAFVALSLLWLAARLEADWSPRRLLVFACVVVFGVMLASPSLFVGSALFAGLVLVLLIDRRFREALWCAAVAGVALAASLALTLWVTLPGPAKELHDYWKEAFIPRGRGMMEALRFIGERLHSVFGAFHLPWWLTVGFIALGLAAFWRARMRTVAVAGPVLLVVLVLAAAVRRYPFMDQRTSTFALAVLALYAGIGVAALGAWLWRRRVLGVIAVIALGGLVVPVRAAAVSAMRVRVPLENMRDQVAYVHAHRQAGDVIVVNYPGSHAFSYYWPGRPIYRRGAPEGSALNYRVTYPERDGIVIARFRSRADVDAALAKAFAVVRSPGRVWVVLSHDSAAAWAARFPQVRATRIALPGLGRGDGLFLLSP